MRLLEGGVDSGLISRACLALDLVTHALAITLTKCVAVSSTVTVASAVTMTKGDEEAIEGGGLGIGLFW